VRTRSAHHLRRHLGEPEQAGRPEEPWQ